MTDSDTDSADCPALVSEDGSRIEFDGDSSLGRASTNDIVVAENSVSGKHAMLRWNNNSLSIEDLASSNGTIVNGKPILGITTLKDGDKVDVGRVCFRVAIPVSIEDDLTQASLDDAQSLAASPEDTIVAMPANQSSTGSAVPAGQMPGEVRHTRVMAEPAAERTPGSDLERTSFLPHLLVLDDSGKVAELLELDIGSESDAYVWDIGRHHSCQIMLAGEEISSQHAQLQYRGGVWRLVNLLATNGVFVNDARVLSAVLGDGDAIRLGRTQLVFRSEAVAPGKKPIKPSQRTAIEALPEKPARHSKRKQFVRFGAIGIALIIIAGVYLLR